jgi:glycosyltransferase involved in cell wall biosynthesis
MAAEMAPKKINLIIAGWFDKDSQYASSRIELEKIILNDNRIKFVGKSDEMEKLISEIHIGILPTYYREGTPRFLLECMAMKKTIITTSVPGCSHLFLENNCIGIKIDPRSHVAIRDAILEVLKKDLIATGKNSRKVYQNHFSEKVVFNQIIKVYQNRYRASSFLNE